MDNQSKELLEEESLVESFEDAVKLAKLQRAIGMETGIVTKPVDNPKEAEHRAYMALVRRLRHSYKVNGEVITESHWQLAKHLPTEYIIKIYGEEKTLEYLTKGLK